MYKHILIPTDGSPLSDKAAEHGLKLAKAVGARVSFIMATTPFPVFLYNPGFETIPDSYREELEAAAKEVLARLKARATAAGVQCETVQVEQEQAFQAIIDTAEKQGCDLILMASHGRRGLSAVVLGSETLKVLTHSAIPVLVYRDKD